MGTLLVILGFIASLGGIIGMGKAPMPSSKLSKLVKISMVIWIGGLIFAAISGLLASVASG